MPPVILGSWLYPNQCDFFTSGECSTLGEYPECHCSSLVNKPKYSERITNGLIHIIRKLNNDDDRAEKELFKSADEETETQGEHSRCPCHGRDGNLGSFAAVAPVKPGQGGNEGTSTRLPTFKASKLRASQNDLVRDTAGCAHPLYPLLPYWNERNRSAEEAYIARGGLHITWSEWRNLQYFKSTQSLGNKAGGTAYKKLLVSRHFQLYWEDFKRLLQAHLPTARPAPAGGFVLSLAIGRSYQHH